MMKTFLVFALFLFSASAVLVTVSQEQTDNDYTNTRKLHGVRARSIVAQLSTRKLASKVTKTIVAKSKKVPSNKGTKLRKASKSPVVPAKIATLPPVVGTPPPISSTTAPTVATSSPTSYTLTPTIATLTPSHPTPESTLVPSATKSAPVVSTSAPSVSTPAPTTDIPVPRVQTSTPTVATLTPAFATPAPTALSTPDQSLLTTTPTLRPLIRTQTPTIATVGPTRSTEFPTGATSTPSLSTRAPITVSTPAPSTSTPPPTIATPVPTSTTMAPVGPISVIVDQAFVYHTCYVEPYQLATTIYAFGRNEVDISFEISYMSREFRMKLTFVSFEVIPTTDMSPPYVFEPTVEDRWLPPSSFQSNTGTITNVGAEFDLYVTIIGNSEAGETCSGNYLTTIRFPISSATTVGTTVAQHNLVV